MNKRPFSSALKSLAISAGIALAAASAPASAAIVWSGGSTGELDTTATYGDSFTNGAATSGFLTFDLIGYRSLDGRRPTNNFYEDDFTLKVNGISVLTGTFNMHGGGADIVFTSPSSTIWNTSAPNLPCSNPNLQMCGGTTHFVVPIALLANASNTLSFSYANTLHQGLSDEAWGLGKASVNAVPEPETYVMLLAGLGMLGTIVRRRRQIK